MSWSISFIGKPDNVALAIEGEATKMEGQSRLEYEDAVPHLAALVRQNFAKEGTAYQAPCVRITASGHGTSRDLEQVQRQLSVTIEANYTKLV